MKFTKNKFGKILYESVSRYHSNGREDSQNFLLWFLHNYYRLDEDVSPDYICDHKNDKGIDGIYVDDNTEEVFIFQSKFPKNFKKNQGDVDLRSFIGSKQWFTQENIHQLDNSRACKELKDLVNRLEVFDKLEKGFKLNLVFITTAHFDNNANDYIRITKDKVEYWDCNDLFDNYTFIGSNNFVRSNYIFNLNDSFIKYTLSKNTPTYIFAVKAKDLINLDGIIDRTLFSKNVRFGLGRTRVNKDIKDTINKSSEHQNFLLYNNGITLITEEAVFYKKSNKLKITNYSIVNGCQTTLTLYENRNNISNNLELILKVIETGKNTKIGESITYFTNNQNPISMVDLWSRDKFQLDLKEKFIKTFKNKILYKIKPGESTKNYSIIIDNTLAAQLIYSFILERPHDAHLKTMIFSNYYNQIFSRRVDEYLIYFLYRLYNLIDKIILNDDAGIKEPIIKSYKLTRFFFLCLIKRIMQEDKIGKTFFENYGDFSKKYEDKFESAFTSLIKILILEFNHEIETLKDSNDYVDYKNLLRNSEKVKDLISKINTAYKRILVHHSEDNLYKMLE